ncbi:MAG: endonuclease/exonuclease/phosphatase family protein [Pseudomonadota bacterium]
MGIANHFGLRHFGLRHFAVAGLSLILAGCGATQSTPPLTSPTDPTVLRIASHNVHYIMLGKETGRWSVGDWHRRKRAVDMAFKAIAPDIIAFQEMESFRSGSDGSVNLARDFLLEENPDYAAAANGDWRTFPSTQPIFYRTDRLTLLDQGWFFFSDTPDVIYSRTFDGSYPAFASWARFQPRAPQSAFLVMNIHFEYKSAFNRERSAALVVDRLATWTDRGEPVILIGDVNARLGSDTISQLETSGVRFAPFDGATYHFNVGLNLFNAIDHIATTPNISWANRPLIVRRQFDGTWPSDHYPIVLDIRLPKTN